jgi:hypothetical protein
MNLFVAMILAVGAVAVLPGCEREGPLEEAGEEVDEAVEDAGDAIEDATDR